MLSINKLEEISFEDFKLIYLKGNKPCLFSKTFTKNWNCFSTWCDNSTINFSTLFQFKKLDDKVSVADCNKTRFDSHATFELTVSEFLSYWHNFHSLKDTRLLYLKDWHYFLGNSDARALFNLPIYFSQDWLNEFSDLRPDSIDDYRFVYLGVQGTWTGLHCDVLHSYSWSANIVGRKRWILFLPGTEKSLPAGLDVREDTLWKSVPHIDVIQEPGEIMFVPSGWFHAVVNLTDCLSINHNWLNRFSIESAWRHVLNQLTEVEESTAEVAEIPGYPEACQTCLGAYCGFQFHEFAALLESIVYTRLAVVMGTVLDSGMVISGERQSDTDLAAMRLRFERIFVTVSIDALRTISDDHPEEWADIESALSVLRQLASDNRAELIGLMSADMRRFLDL